MSCARQDTLRLLGFWTDTPELLKHVSAATSISFTKQRLAKLERMRLILACTWPQAAQTALKVQFDVVLATTSPFRNEARAICLATIAPIPIDIASSLADPGSPSDVSGGPICTEFVGRGKGERSTTGGTDSRPNPNRQHPCSGEIAVCRAFGYGRPSVVGKHQTWLPEQTQVPLR